ncbi:hypothetical protein M3J09_012203 [Ascochyta lentis]
MDPSASSVADTSGRHQTLRKLHNTKITITIDCEDILKPDVYNPGKHTFQSGSEAVQHLQLGQIVGIATLSHIKIKLTHTCGFLNIEGEPCLEALWNVGQGLVELFEASGRNASCERWTNGRSKDWLEVDAKVMVYLD